MADGQCKMLISRNGEMADLRMEGKNNNFIAHRLSLFKEKWIIVPFLIMCSIIFTPVMPQQGILMESCVSHAHTLTSQTVASSYSHTVALLILVHFMMGYVISQAKYRAKHLAFYYVYVITMMMPWFQSGIRFIEKM